MKTKKNKHGTFSISLGGGGKPKPDIGWSIIKKCNKYAPGNRFCDLCCSEKLEIMKAGTDQSNIYKRNEIASICVHRNRCKLARIKWRTSKASVLNPGQYREASYIPSLREHPWLVKHCVGEQGKYSSYCVVV